MTEEIDENVHESCRFVLFLDWEELYARATDPPRGTKRRAQGRTNRENPKKRRRLS